MIDICDNEIIYMAQEQNDDALEYILKKYKYLIDVLMFKYNFKLSNIKADLKELYNLCYFSLIEAINKYDCKKEALFLTFASLIIKRQIIKYINKMQTYKNTININSVSYDYLFELKDNKLLNSVNNIKYDPYCFIENCENSKIFNNLVRKHLSAFEEKVYTYLLDGYNYVQIAVLLKKTNKQIDNAIQRIRRKIKLLIYENKLN